MKGVADYSAGLMSEISSWSSSASGSAASARQFGDSGNHMIVACEKRLSITNKINTHGNFDSRLLQAISVKEVASQIEQTSLVLPQLFRLDGQTGQS